MVINGISIYVPQSNMHFLYCSAITKIKQILTHIVLQDMSEGSKAFG